MPERSPAAAPAPSALAAPAPATPGSAAPAPSALAAPALATPAARTIADVLADAARGIALDTDDAELLLGAQGADLEALLDAASARRDAALAAGGRAGVITFSKKVFIPVTTLCRDRCHYCIFVDTPGKLERKHKPVYMSPEQILSVATQGAALGVKEALFTLGDRPEERWPEARAWLDEHGYASTIDYLRAMGELVLERTGLLPHMNPGVMSRAELETLREVAPSMGMMLETTSRRLFEEPGQVHYGSPDKDPDVRMRVIDDAGAARIPFTTGILVGIGETLRDRAESLVAIRSAHARHGQVQEVIVQNFRAKDATAMQGAADLGTLEYVAAIATARLVMPLDVTVQAPPNLADPAELGLLVRAGIDDWGGVSPLTADHVNPERPWPQIGELARHTAASGYALRERLTAHPSYVADADTWIDAGLRERVRALADTESSLADERAGAGSDAPVSPRRQRRATLRPGDSELGIARLSGTASVSRALSLARTSADDLTESDVAALLTARGDELDELVALASDQRRYTVGEAVSVVVNRNLSPAHPGLTLGDVAAVAADALELGATELCVQGTGALDPLAIALTVTDAAPGLHLHAFRPYDVDVAAGLADLEPERYYALLAEAGVGSVPGTGVQPGDRSMRAGIDVPGERWEELLTAAHGAGLSSTTVMFYGGGETTRELAAHVLRVRRLALATGGVTELVPMPARDDLDLDVHRAATAVARVALHGAVRHIQVAWPRLGEAGVRAALQSGADDLGGVLLAGRVLPEASPTAGRSLPLADAARIARRLSRTLRERSTLYGPVSRPSPVEEPAHPLVEEPAPPPLVEEPASAASRRLETTTDLTPTEWSRDAASLRSGAPRPTRSGAPRPTRSGAPSDGGTGQPAPPLVEEPASAASQRLETTTDLTPTEWSRDAASLRSGAPRPTRSGAPRPTSSGAPRLAGGGPEEGAA
ncbi:7,8-didemethyl-8-hydroxy-5-deazariboflavin synthase CofG [Galbitalea sp. SE-J8]|uniref:7,8-didemethyl-8-hydroxy-5-deazariboflavin synthase CofG n=1 Tax=Galbitalea sp. SE-J8 TaxID=3054952 RepID=UPI00259D2A4A|nr:7,8-didemethyl-8-hydroxy-5-deazariboflavin synthase CofG [Galbitalea sp. SE-J8]MDM4762170.1 7,8-didemethyl-8-hydroxy-5-deazariboflavin synthase CofG [Galbitalea sp. SE-J8]